MKPDKNGTGQIHLVTKGRAITGREPKCAIIKIPNSKSPLKGSIVCNFLQPEIRWPEERKKAFPTGKLIDTLFKDDMINGERKEGWGDGHLSNEIDKKIGQINPTVLNQNFWNLCLRAGCRREGKDCPSLSTSAGRYYCSKFGSHPFDKQLREFRFIWPSLSLTRKRTLILLTLLGVKGMRPGGYFTCDIARIAGIDEKRGLELVDYLSEIGLMRRSGRKRERRYLWLPTPENPVPDQFLHTYWDEVWRTRVRNINDGLRTASHFGRRFERKRHFTVLGVPDNEKLKRLGWTGKSSGIILGAVPPAWMSARIDQCLKDLGDHVQSLRGKEKSDWIRFQDALENEKSDHCSLLISDLSSLGEESAGYWRLSTPRSLRTEAVRSEKG